MLLCWTQHAWADYVYWQGQDKKTLKRINALIKDVQRDPFDGIGKPEHLKWLGNTWSRRIDHEHRLVYDVHDDRVVIIQCRYHY